MSENCFIRQEATLDIITNVTSVCNECYASITDREIIFYDMQNYRYLCQSCKDNLQEKLDDNCELIKSEPSSLFSL